MTGVLKTSREWLAAVGDGWNRFWFTPEAPHTLAMIRILGGAMLLYTHLVWTLDLMAFVGPNSWITSDVSIQIQRDMGNLTAWSFLWYIESPTVLWTVHLFALVVFAMLTCGLFTRVTSVLAFVLTLSYCHRLNGALFGLDQVNAMLSMYLMLAPCGAVYSIDRWLKLRRSPAAKHDDLRALATNVAIRLIQLHLCVIYLFGGIGKMRGELWWDGNATWFAVANLEYQSLDMTWMVHYPWLIALLTHVTVFWETFYCALVWPRATRPIALLLAVFVHGGICLFLGMITFGSAMLIVNLSFVSPRIVQGVVTWGAGFFKMSGEGRAVAAPASGRH